MLGKRLREGKRKEDEKDQDDDAERDLFKGQIPHVLPTQKALRPYPDGDQIDEEDDGKLVSRIDEEASEGLGQADDDPCDKSSLDAAEASQSYDAERDQSESTSNLGIDIIVGG